VVWPRLITVLSAAGRLAQQPRLHVQLDYIPPELYETANYA